MAMANPQARRLYRRLQLRRFKRMLGMRVFDFDGTVREYMRRRQHMWNTGDEDNGKTAIDVVPGHEDHGMSADVTADTEGCEDASRQNALEIRGQKVPDAWAEARFPKESEQQTEDGGQLVSVTPYQHSFASRLLGRAVLRDSLTSPVARVSPYHGRLLRPYIWRDWIKEDGSGEQASSAMEPAVLWMHRDIRSRRHKIFGNLEATMYVAEADKCETAGGSESIDYVYFQEEHVEQVNALLVRTFWSGVDVKEALMYPEFTVVALHKRLVIGCAFLTPDAYLTYIAVSAGWEGAGIAKFMLYHLTQTVPTKDVTLHVSANNAAMVLYQQFGFKPEKYVVNFYKAYLPESSRLSANAFFMRLRRY
ncbi:hypothetical protein LPJ59_002343 [Coemansia sp. RSA 2399]|nr:hypothetical protein LPJ59_002343 [Coemansia sp. RSA 2399]